MTDKQSRKYDLGMKWLPLIVWLAASIGLPDFARGQVNQDRGQGAPLNVQTMDQFWANKAKFNLNFLRLPGISPDYRLGVGDTVKITVVGNMFSEQMCEISNSGEISFPLLGFIKAKGLTAEELESEIAMLLQEKELVKSPEVLVFIDSYESKPFWVLGNVDYPGEFRMSQQLTVMDAIFMAGGIDFGASRYAYVHRRIVKNEAEKPLPGKPTPRGGKDENLELAPEEALQGEEVIKIDLQQMRDGGVLKSNILIQANDVLVVPKRPPEFFYVIGDVTHSGAFEIPEETTVNVSQALSWAGGPSKTAKMSKSVLVRFDQTGKRQEMKIDYAAILKGDQPDFEIHPNDILFIPGSNIKNLGYGLLGVIPSTVQQNVPIR